MFQTTSAVTTLSVHVHKMESFDLVYMDTHNFHKHDFQNVCLLKTYFFNEVFYNGVARR